MILIFAIAAILIAYFTVEFGILIVGKQLDLNEKIDSALVNGVLTGTAIIFAFIGFELRELKVSPIEKFFLVLPALFTLILAVESYFISAMSYGIATKGVMVWVIVDFLFTALYYVISMHFKSFYEEMNRPNFADKNKEEASVETNTVINIEMQKEYFIRKKKRNVRAFVKMLSMFVAVVSVLLAIILAVASSSYNILILALFGIYFLVTAFILGLDTLSEWAKEREHDNDILTLQGKYQELERKYNKLLKEQQKSKEYLSSLQKETTGKSKSTD
jgi:sensor histidine kinase YesM